MRTVELSARIEPLLQRLFPVQHADVRDRVVVLAERYADLLRDRHITTPTQRTACVITYGDGIRRRGETPLHTLAGFLHDHVGDVFSDVHLLPMFPWTSDDGFVVVDHRAVNPALGTWADVAELADDPSCSRTQSALRRAAEARKTERARAAGSRAARSFAGVTRPGA